MGYLQYIDYGNPSSPLKVVSFHGFPSIRSAQNRELADHISKALNCRVRVVLYPGLSCDGVFSFKKTIAAMINEFEAITENQKVDLLGHSFGGFSSILLAATYPKLVRRMVLLSPLLRFSSSVAEITQFFDTVLGTGEGINTLPPSELANEFYDLSQEYRVEELVESLDPKIKIKFMQARIDAITPVRVAEEFRQYFKGDFDYEPVNQDHSFLSNRPALALKIADFLK